MLSCYIPSYTALSTFLLPLILLAVHQCGLAGDQRPQSDSHH